MTKAIMTALVLAATIAFAANAMAAMTLQGCKSNSSFKACSTAKCAWNAASKTCAVKKK